MKAIGLEYLLIYFVFFISSLDGLIFVFLRKMKYRDLMYKWLSLLVSETQFSV